MGWDIHTRVDRHDAHIIHIKARRTALASIQDVSLDCGRGVRPVNVGGSARREMNAFSTAIEGAFRWDDEAAAPEVVLTWSDMGELGEQRILLSTCARHHVLPLRLRRLPHGRPQAGA